MTRRNAIDDLASLGGLLGRFVFDGEIPEQITLNGAPPRAPRPPASPITPPPEPSDPGVEPSACVRCAGEREVLFRGVVVPCPVCVSAKGSDPCR